MLPKKNATWNISAYNNGQYSSPSGQISYGGIQECSFSNQSDTKNSQFTLNINAQFLYLCSFYNGYDDINQSALNIITTGVKKPSDKQINQHGIYNCDIKAGNGNNTINTGLIQNITGPNLNKKIIMGNGNNVINAESILDANLKFGNGNNKIELSDKNINESSPILKSTDLNFGNGRNIISIDGELISSNYNTKSEIIGNTINFGNKGSKGNNTITTTNICNYKINFLGNGNDSIINNGNQIGSSISMGAGNDSYTLTYAPISKLESEQDYLKNNGSFPK